jgi:sugar lactone lactonase YvrE
VFVYAPDGKPLGQIDVPDRPLQLIVGGSDRRTLFILTHHALYAARLRAE